MTFQINLTFNFNCLLASCETAFLSDYFLECFNKATELVNMDNIGLVIGPRHDHTEKTTSLDVSVIVEKTETNTRQNALQFMDVYRDTFKKNIELKYEVETKYRSLQNWMGDESHCECDDGDLLKIVYHCP